MTEIICRAGDTAPMQHVVVAGLLRSGKRFLLVHRSRSRRWYPDVWDFPGGHVEPGERPADALKRELFEELGIHIKAVDGCPIIRRQNPEADLDLSVWRIRSWCGTITNRQPTEHDAIGWFDQDELAGLKLADPSYLTALETALSDAGD